MPDAEPTREPTREPTGPADGRARLLRALRRPGPRGQVVAAVLLAALGFAGVTQVRANGRDDNYVGARQGDLVQLINNLSLASQRTETEISRLQGTREALGNDTEARRTAIDRAQEQAATLGILAGTLPAVGPGVRVTITDTRHGVGTNQLLDGLQELRDAGAEAIELNDQVRVVAQTFMQDRAGSGILVDGTVLEPPYVIDAIGDPHTLATGLQFARGFADEVEGVGGKVSIKELGSVEVSTIVRTAPPKYAQPAGTR
jgi:uncharacterized protein YlxW (UPF0749 family)